MMMSLALMTLLATAQEPDVLLADFEGETYGGWTTTGAAFGERPAPGTLPGQMAVSGFLGKGLANSFHGGDAPTGTLTSPEFEVNRHYVTFLIGGGAEAGKTCVNLVVDGKVLRTAVGPNSVPGGSEELIRATWDVADLRGKKARVVAVDEASGGWGHVTLDHVVLTDARPAPRDGTREVAVEHHYLHLPVRSGAPKRRMKLEVSGTIVREFEIELAAKDPEFWAFVDVAPWKGATLHLEAKGSGVQDALDSVTQSDELPAYQEAVRPAFHFTSRRGWLNDPNGMVFYKGEYHLYYQHNPFGWSWGNMHWGHAVSKDLVRWEELPEAIYPAKFGDWAFSGSAVVDRENTSGFKSGDDDVLVGAYTSTGRGECIVYSNDRGRTWKEYAGNPVVKHDGRDPRLLWHKATKQWVMAVYDEEAKKRRIAFHTSPDLRSWTFRSMIDGFYECPDLFELPFEGDAAQSRWVLLGADGKYLLGAFDGHEFKPEGDKHQVWYGNFYASQTFSDAPDGRRIQIGWANGTAFPGQPFNQQMNVPVELTLRTTPDGPRMVASPVRELDRLHDRKREWKDRTVQPGENPLTGVEAELADIRVAFRPQGVDQVTITVRGVPVVYDVHKRQLSSKGRTSPLGPVGDVVRLRLLVDRGSIEIFGNDGEVALAVGAMFPPSSRALALTVTGGPLSLSSLEVVELKSSPK